MRDIMLLVIVALLGSVSTLFFIGAVMYFQGLTISAVARRSPPPPPAPARALRAPLPTAAALADATDPLPLMSGQDIALSGVMALDDNAQVFARSAAPVPLPIVRSLRSDASAVYELRCKARNPGDWENGLVPWIPGTYSGTSTQTTLGEPEERSVGPMDIPPMKSECIKLVTVSQNKMGLIGREGEWTPSVLNQSAVSAKILKLRQNGVFVEARMRIVSPGDWGENTGECLRDMAPGEILVIEQYNTLFIKVTRIS